MIKLYLIIILVTLGVVGYAKHEPKEKTPTIYANGWEKHDLETWRKRGIETAKSKNDKSIIKHTDVMELVGVLYIIHGWNLTKCE